jgi:purine nucleosidase
MSMTIRTILDTDIGTDVDDCLAIGFLLGSPEFRLEGITCVYGDVQLRGRMVRKLLRLAGREDIPVYLGTTPPLLGIKPIYWGGFEGIGLLDGSESNDFPDEHAVDFIVRTVMANPGEIHLLAIGPLTNVALAFRKEPRLAQALAHLTIMGGAIRGPRDLHLPVGEHNIACDPEAAQIVFSAGVPMTLVPLDVTTKTLIRAEHVARIKAAGTPLHLAVADQVERYPRFAANGKTALHDPLAAAVIVDPSLVEFVDVNVAVETQGRLTTAATVFRAPTETAPANARLAISVDAPRAETFIIDRISS